MPLASPAAHAVSLREASFDDYPQIAALETRCNLGSRPFDDWRAFWLENPEYRRHRHWPIGWVLENGDGNIIGSMCNIPLGYEFEGERITATTGRGWVVDPDYRSYACLLLDELFQQKYVDLFLNTTVNRHAEEAYRTFDSPPVPAGKWDSSAFWITNYRGFTRSFLAAKRWKGGSFLSAPAAAALFLKDKLTAVPARARDGNPVALEEGFDERFDVFWEELRRRKRHVVLAIRSREMLAWHLRYHLRKKRLYILTMSSGKRLVAYSVFCRKEEETYGLRHVRLIDYQSLDDGESLASMLSWMLNRCREEGIHMLEDVGCSIQEIAAPHHRQLSSWLFYYKANRPALVSKLSDAASWQTSLFDGDSSL